MSDADVINAKIDMICDDIKCQREDFTELKKYVEQLANSQVRIESMFVSQKEVSDLNLRLTKLETYIIILGGAIGVVATSLIPYFLEVFYG